MKFRRKGRGKARRRDGTEGDRKHKGWQGKKGGREGGEEGKEDREGLDNGVRTTDSTQ